jgi:DNA processing protein
MERKHLKYWLALTRIKGIERFPLKAFHESGLSPELLFRKRGAPRGIMGIMDECPKDTLDSIKAFDGWAWVEEELKRVKECGARVIPFSSEEYPGLLREINDPPPALYAKGRAFDNARAPVSVVGTRLPTPYGVRMSEALSRDLSLAGVVVVSGMARGCDTSAHRGALTAGGFTVAVLGTGVDVVYPRESRRLYDEICDKGIVISEFPMSTGPMPYNFPRRNRIISGMSRGVIVAEAPLRSGALMTARLALEYGREVFAVPGQATSTKSAGANRLIKQGAILVETAKDALDALSIECPSVREEAVAPEGAGERLLWEALVVEPLHIDSIIEKTGLPPSTASSLLLEMELKGMVMQRPGKLFSRRV